MSRHEFDPSEPIFIEPDESGEEIRIRLADQTSPTFPLSRAEAQLMYDELKTHWFNRDHPHYHYSDSLMDRLKKFAYGDKD